MDDPLQKIINYMEVAFILLIILIIISVIFIPIYAIFYLKTNYSDEHPWAKKMMKGWLVVASVLGIIFTFFFFIFLYANLVVSATCYYSNELIVNHKNFMAKHKSDLGIENDKISRIVNNCFD